MPENKKATINPKNNDNNCFQYVEMPNKDNKILK